MRPRHAFRAAAVALLAPMLSACMTGLIYTHVTVPLTLNFDRTPVMKAAGAGSIEHIHVPLTRIDVDVVWSSNAIGDIARSQGLEEVYYADLETFSILTIWNQYTVHLYGIPTAKP